MSILVACIGNIFQGDDAFGCEVARILAHQQFPEDVRVVDFGIRGLDLIYAVLEAPELLILVDAVPRDDAPGTLYTIEPDLADLQSGGGQSMDAHSMDPVQVLRAALSMGAKLKRVLLVGCQPGDLGGEQGKMGLTPEVSASVAEAASIVGNLIQNEYKQTGQFR